MVLWKDRYAARKVVKVYLTPQQKKLLQRIRQSLGMNESEVLRYAFMKYAESISLVVERVHGKSKGAFHKCRRAERTPQFDLRS
ncbi:hypothetical protein KAU92_01580 [Candidatus Bathyarchaeota archaeon]|nr:hypothetical protein [Candidatus Bathyarchaeota archaeon]MCK4668911.1 hypothetical protein [Candidatus Bathyarchaeota archaeon]